MLASEKFDHFVVENMENSFLHEVSFFKEYCSFLRQYPAIYSRFHRLCNSLSKDARIILKLDLLSTLDISFQRKYYDLLLKFGMREKDEVLDCVSEISCAIDPLKEVKKWNKISWFQIEVNDGKYTVTFLGEKYSFIPIRSIIPKEIKKIEAMHKEEVGYSCHNGNGYDAYAPGNLDYACHFSSLCFSSMFLDYYALTSLCPHIREGGYWYHSFNLANDESTVYDVANGFIIDYDSFLKMLEPVILDSTLGFNIERRRQILCSSSSSFYQDFGENCPLKGFAFQNYDQMSTEKQSKLLKRITD